MKYKGLFPDTFFEAEADSEEEAQRKMLTQLREQLDKPGEHFIVWEEPEAPCGCLPSRGESCPNCKPDALRTTVQL